MNSNNKVCGEGDFVDLILRDSNNLIVIGIIQLYNTMSNLADIAILPSLTHNFGNIDRFVELKDLRDKGFRLNDESKLNENENDYLIGFNLDY